MSYIVTISVVDALKAKKWQLWCDMDERGTSGHSGLFTSSYAATFKCIRIASKCT